MVKNNYVICPDEYLLPMYRISTFSTKDIIFNIHLNKSKIIDEYFKSRFINMKYCYTENGRKAINLALSKLNLNCKDNIAIITTSNNFYVSGCVTKEIEKICKWKRQIEPNTKAIFVIHEFGFPYEKLTKLKEYNIPIIEDCAYAFNSNNSEESVGMVGDFVIYSFPKFFPIQIGGLLVHKNNYNIESKIDEIEKEYIQKVLSYYVEDIDNWSLQRVKNYQYLEKKFSQINLEYRFKLKKNYIPGVFMFKVDNKIEPNNLKKFIWNHGIQCSVFYKENTMFIPIHNRLNTDELDYFYEVIKYYIYNL
ncbi:aminotransferase DegT [Clostridium gelidum]|uniref:Aminotransferase DegT n=1 Tax=Clostridium gelidum TaxID=704125 RepID=A0ABM7T549_9CLOT|nr:DegT/DnrJ/EryC1/StrS family aminotransferase [Clostridium gelidum]BCZ47089.1 aminotransferase DegT [Clostridium gelidum]